MSARKLRIFLILLLTSAIWGAAAPVIKYTLQGFSPEVFLFYRFAISSAIALLGIALYGLNLPKNPRILLWSLFYAFLSSTVALGLLFLGYKSTSAVDGGLISAVGPLLVTLAGAVFLHEHVTKKEKTGLVIAFLGTAITVAEPLLRNHGGEAAFTGNLLIIASLVAGVATAVIAKVLLRDRVTPTTATNLIFLVGFFTMAPLALSAHTPSEIITILKDTALSYHLGVWYMAVLSGSFAYYLWHKAQKSTDIGEVALFSYLYPFFSTPLAVFWLGEKITPYFAVGAVVIAIGIIIAEFRLPPLVDGSNKSR